MAKELYNQNLADNIEDDERLSFTKPGRTGAKNILWSRFKEILGFGRHNDLAGRDEQYTHPATSISYGTRSVDEELNDSDQGTAVSAVTAETEFMVQGENLGLATAVQIANYLNVNSGFATVITTDQDVNPALPWTYYRIDASVAPRTVYLPDPVAGCKDEFSIELHKDTHKVTITTVSGLAGAIEGFDKKVIPTIGTALRFKCDELNGYFIVDDTRALWSEQIITADRNFTADSFENNIIYKIQPATHGGTVNIILPVPTGLNDNKIIRATFILISAGSAVFSRIDGGNIGSENTQTITSVDKGFTLAEANNEFSIIQDSRPTSSNLLGLNYYRLQEISDIAGYRRLTTTKSDPDYNVVTQEEQTASITLETFSVFLEYIASEEDTPSTIPAGTVQFNETIKKTTDTQANVIAKYQLCKRDSGGTETILAETSQFTVSLITYQQFIVNLDFPETNLASDERLVFKELLAKTSGSGTPTLTIKFEGSEPAYFNVSTNVQSIDHNQLQGRTATNAHPSESISYKSETVKSRLDKIVPVSSASEFVSAVGQTGNVSIILLNDISLEGVNFPMTINADVVNVIQSSYRLIFNSASTAFTTTTAKMHIYAPVLINTDLSITGNATGSFELNISYMYSDVIRFIIKITESGTFTVAYSLKNKNIILGGEAINNTGWAFPQDYFAKLLKNPSAINQIDILGSDSEGQYEPKKFYLVRTEADFELALTNIGNIGIVLLDNITLDNNTYAINASRITIVGNGTLQINGTVGFNPSIDVSIVTSCSLTLSSPSVLTQGSVYDMSIELQYVQSPISVYELTVNGTGAGLLDVRYCFSKNITFTDIGTGISAQFDTVLPASQLLKTSGENIESTAISTLQLTDKVLIEGNSSFETVPVSELTDTLRWINSGIDVTLNGEMSLSTGRFSVSVYVELAVNSVPTQVDMFPSALDNTLVKYEECSNVLLTARPESTQNYYYEVLGFYDAATDLQSSAAQWGNAKGDCYLLSNNEDDIMTYKLSPNQLVLAQNSSFIMNFDSVKDNSGMFAEIKIDGFIIGYGNV